MAIDDGSRVVMEGFKLVKWTEVLGEDLPVALRGLIREREVTNISLLV